MTKQKKNKFVTVQCTEYQLFIIERCLEIISRIGSGQLEHIEDAVSLCKGNAKKITVTDDVILKMRAALASIQDDAISNSSFAWYRLGSAIRDLLKPLLFPELHPSASYGIGNKEIPNGQIMYEIYKKCQNYRAQKENHDKNLVTWHDPLHYSKEPLVEIKELE